MHKVFFLKLYLQMYNFAIVYARYTRYIYILIHKLIINLVQYYAVWKALIGFGVIFCNLVEWKLVFNFDS